MVEPYPSENMSSSVGMMTFPIYRKVKHVPNHQPVFEVSRKIHLSRCNLDVLYVFGDLPLTESEPRNQLVQYLKKIWRLFLVMSSHITTLHPHNLYVWTSVHLQSSECHGWVVEPLKCLNANLDHLPILRSIVLEKQIIMNNKTWCIYIYIHEY